MNTANRQAQMKDERLALELNIDSSKRFVMRYLGLVALLVSMVIASLFFAFNISSSKAVISQLHQHGKSFFDEIVVTRKWLAKHGGVYVPLETSDGVNPYLEKIPGVNAVIEANGRAYTLKNPALVTRELSEAEDHGGKLQYKITSLKALNPHNAPDAFEERSLRLFEQGAAENTAFETMDGKLYYRYMAPLQTEKACLKCHAQQEYKEGDIRGGIAVSILADTIHEELVQARLFMILSGGGVIALIILSILYISRHFIRDLQRAQRQLASMAMTDFLTGLNNRLTGMRLLAQEIARGQRSASLLSVAIIDVDHFKGINDTYGHNTGDEVLVAMANLLRGAVRPYDQCCRYGGEEFLLILPNTELSDARTVVQRLLDQLNATRIPTAKGDIAISFSAGVAQHQPDEEAESLIGRADTLLYEAKAQGRNRVCG